MVSFVRETHRISANGVALDGWLYVPQAQGPFPAIVMSHGFAAVKELYIDTFAEAFAQAGFVVVLYDHRNFGKSGGEVRGEIIPSEQVDDMREVVTWLSLRPEVNAERIGVWGSSFSGGHAITLGALDRRIRCVVSQVPTISGYQNLLRRAGVHIHSALEGFENDRAARYRGEHPGYRHVIAQDGEPGIFSSDGAEAFFSAAWRLAEGWQNRVTVRSSEKASEYEPGLLIERVSPTPLLMLVAEKDTVTPTDLALAAYGRALEPKRLCMLADAHFDPYVKHAALAKREALDWFVRFLG
ncbi:alpha/beta hydrolase [Pseudomonas huaxiensis]|uniref:alpha/beta hydrolase n=1 Tax=Pseudomonas huaxiensis TaxID=2213017 RepID=UPI000DA66700|nr:alpha/beta hydrolase [Pseudomonas huaxiensis]